MTPFWNFCIAIASWLFVGIYLIPIYFDVKNAEQSFETAMEFANHSRIEIDNRMSELSNYYFMCQIDRNKPSILGTPHQ